MIFSAAATVFLHSANAQTTDVYTECIDTDDECDFTSWADCVDDQFYREGCCMSCHVISFSDPESPSCWSEGFSDIMTPTECSLAALRTVGVYLEMRGNQQQLYPQGCFLSANGEEIYWNPVLTSLYEPVINGYRRVCMDARFPTRPPDRTFSPLTNTALGREFMSVPELDEVDDDYRFIENEITCADQNCDGLAPDKSTCMDLSDRQNIPFETDSDPYLPGGCFFLDGNLIWNEGGGIEFPPPYDRAFYSHVCSGCEPDRCQVPVWVWLVISMFILIIVLLCAAFICYNFQSFREKGRNYIPSYWASKEPRGNVETKSVSMVPPPNGAPREQTYNFDKVGSSSYPARSPQYPFRGSESWEQMPQVPMNLFNKSRA